MADDLDLEGADHVADEADALHGAAGGHQRRGHGQEGVAGADGIDHVLGEGRDGMHGSAALVGHAAVLAVRDDDLRGNRHALENAMRDIADRRQPIAAAQAALPARRCTM